MNDLISVVPNGRKICLIIPTKVIGEPRLLEAGTIRYIIWHDVPSCITALSNTMGGRITEFISASTTEYQVIEEV